MRPAMLIETKLRQPAPGAHVLPRPELLAQLDRVAEGRLALVVVPTGFGKTTLLAQWARMQQAAGAAVGWFSADASENDMVIPPESKGLAVLTWPVIRAKAVPSSVTKARPPVDAPPIT